MKQMLRRNKLFFLALLLILIGSVPIAYSLIVFPNPPAVRDWNFGCLEKIAAENNQPGAFSFAVFGDNKNSISVFKKLIETINDDDVVFSIETGDLIDNMFDGESEYRTYVEQIKRLKKPLLVIPGNHETEGRQALFKHRRAVRSQCNRIYAQLFKGALGLPAGFHGDRRFGGRLVPLESQKNIFQIGNR